MIHRYYSALEFFIFTKFSTPVLFHLNLACSVQLVSGEIVHGNKSCLHYLFSRETDQFVIVFIIDILLLINYLVDFNKIK